MRLILCVTLFLLLLLSWGILEAQTTYYVRQAEETRQGRKLPRGSDNVTCIQAKNQQTPRASINMGIACLAAGDTLHIGAGSYDELIFGQYSASLTCAEGDAAHQPCHVVPNGVDPDHPTKLIGTGTAVISPRGREPVGGGSIFTAYDASRHIYLEGLRFVMNSASGSAGGVHFGNGQYMTLHHNEVAKGTVKSSDKSRYHTITANYIHHAGQGCQQGVDPGMCPHGVYGCGQDHVFTDNHVAYSSYYNVQYSCEGGGLARIQILRNRIEYAWGVGIRCAATDCLVGANVLVGNGSGITASGTVTIANNTIHGFREGASDPWGIYWTAGNNVTVLDNILTAQKSAWYALGQSDFSPPTTSKVNHNLCEQADPNPGCTLRAAASSVYANVETGDYTLKAGSPAIQAGVSTTVTQDVQGVPYPSPPDLGAYSSGTPQPEPPQPQPPGGLTLTCSGELGAKGAIALTCTQQGEGRR